MQGCQWTENIVLEELRLIYLVWTIGEVKKGTYNNNIVLNVFADIFQQLASHA